VVNKKPQNIMIYTKYHNIINLQ